MTRRAWGSSLAGVLLLVLSALPASAQSTETTTAPRSTTISAPTKFESDILMYINNHRVKIGCVKLTYNGYLAYAARQHTSRMVAAQTLSHQLSRESSLGVRITNAGYINWRMLAENLAYGTRSPWSTYSLWMGSAPHRANIQNCTLRNAGVGTAWVDSKSWDTIDFGRQ